MIADKRMKPPENKVAMMKIKRMGRYW